MRGEKGAGAGRGEGEGWERGGRRREASRSLRLQCVEGSVPRCGQKHTRVRGGMNKIHTSPPREGGGGECARAGGQGGPGVVKSGAGTVSRARAGGKDAVRKTLGTQ